MWQRRTSNVANLSLRTAANSAKTHNKPWLRLCKVVFQQLNTEQFTKKLQPPQQTPGKQTKQWPIPVQMWTANHFVMSKKLTKNGSLHGTNLLPCYCCIHIRRMFVTGPSQQIFAAITFVAAPFMPHSSCARSSGPSLTDDIPLSYWLPDDVSCSFH